MQDVKPGWEKKHKIGSVKSYIYVRSPVFKIQILLPMFLEFPLPTNEGL